MAVFPTHTLYLGSLPRYINSRLEQLVTHFSISSVIDLLGEALALPYCQSHMLQDQTA